MVSLACVSHSVQRQGEGVGFPACITNDSDGEGVCICIQGGGDLYQGWGRADTWDTARYGQQVGSMHPTGMHTCWNICTTGFI